MPEAGQGGAEAEAGADETEARGPACRKPAFTVAGAPAEPLDEIVLSARAKQLAAWVEKHPRRTRAGSTTGSTSTTGSSPAPASAGRTAPRRCER